MIIGHISDIHWLDTTGTHVWDYLNKRLSGGINLIMGRAKKHRKETARNALETLRQIGCDHLIVTGDISNLALPTEFASVKQAMDEYFDDDHKTIVPGNHDYYTRESFKARRFETMIYTQAPGNLDVGVESTWPFVKIIDDIAIIGLNSARPRPWFVASGILGQQQLDDLEKVLQHPEVASHFKIVALHHNLFQIVTTPGECLRNLRERKELLEIVQKYGVQLVIHGHDHDYFYKKIGDLVIAEAGSCSVCRFKSDNRAGKFNRYFIENGRLEKIETWRYEHEKYDFWKEIAVESSL